MKRSSVLPKIAFTRTDEGALLLADRVGGKELVLMFFLALGVVANGYIFFLREVDDDRRILSLVYAAMMLIGLVGVDIDYRRRKHLRGVSLTVRPWPIRLGDEVKIQLRVRPALPAVSKLECAEYTIRGGGKWARTNNATLYSLELAASEGTFVIPDHLPPSFEVKDNKVVWWVTAVIQSRRGAEIPVMFKLLVIPEVAG